MMEMIPTIYIVTVTRNMRWHFIVTMKMILTLRNLTVTKNTSSFLAKTAKKCL